MQDNIYLLFNKTNVEFKLAQTHHKTINFPTGDNVDLVPIIKEHLV